MINLFVTRNKVVKSYVEMCITLSTEGEKREICRKLFMEILSKEKKSVRNRDSNTDFTNILQT